MKQERERIAELFKYKGATPEMKAAMARIAEKAELLVMDLMAEVPQCADRSAAVRKVREAVFTANYAITHAEDRTDHA